MCPQELCPCHHHSAKIKNDFYDIFDVEYTLTEEREIVRRVTQETERG